MNGSIMLGENRVRTGTSRFLSQGAFVVYRTVLAVYGFFFGVYWPLKRGHRIEKYFTFWTFYAAAAYFVVAAISATLCWRAIKWRASSMKGKTRQGELPRLAREAPLSPLTSDDSVRPVPRWLRRLHLVLWNIACIAPLVVITVFWGALYDGGALSSVDIHAHGLIPIVMFFDQALVADEFQLRHMIFTEIYGFMYFVFNIAWYYATPKQEDRLIYHILDWEAKTSTACLYFAMAIFILVPLFAFLHLLAYSLRERVHTGRRNVRIATGTETSPTESPPGGSMEY